ncbi:hypothetical protein PtA15_10A398 [Puccinia triticina]|uniref:Uncharacterized protein n=1 Tax=Puccinia triticina TaxID=208348 RepID=A0ABY7CVG5_9BASI|nr:uncharacterized protein PtA15_10A398 [Puccinia triticina]WAQ88975.1 hypothetical protein PtA15_10A398 [Puccinia triticina]
MLCRSLLLSSLALSVLAGLPELSKEMNAGASRIRKSRTDDRLHALAIKPDTTPAVPDDSGPPRKKRRIDKDILPERRSRILESWDVNQEKVEMLHEYSKQIAVLGKKLKRYLSDVEHGAPHLQSQQVFEARQLLEQSEKNMQDLKQWKLLQFANIKTYFSPNELTEWLISAGTNTHSKTSAAQPVIPIEVSSTVFEKYLQRFGNLVLKDVMKLLTDHRNLFDDPHMKRNLRRADFSTAWKYASKFVDFLFENGLITAGMVREMFEDDKIVKEAIFHTSNYINRHGFFTTLAQQPVRFTTHWYWLCFNKYHSALGKKEETILDLVSHVEYVMKIGQELMEERESTYAESEYHSKAKALLRNWQDVSKRFSTENYFSKLKDLLAANGDPTYSARKDGLGAPMVVDPSGFKEEMVSMITHLIMDCPEISLARYGNNEKLLRAIFVLLGYIESNLCPGIIHGVIQNVPFPQLIRNTESRIKDYQPSDLEDIVKLVSLASSSYNTSLLALTYHHFYEENDFMARYGCKFELEIFQSYQKMKDEIKSEYRETYDRVCVKNQSMPLIIYQNFHDWMRHRYASTWF